MFGIGGLEVLEEFYQGFLVGVVVFPVAEIADYFLHDIGLSLVFPFVTKSPVPLFLFMVL